MFACKFTAPAPANVAISSALASFSVPPAFTVTAILFANALPPLNVNVPASTTVAPLYVFAPESVNSALPAFVRSNAPLTTPLIVTSLATVSVVAADSAAAPDNVNAPVFVPSPKLSPPLSVNAFANVRALALSLAIFPPLNTTVPPPNAALFPTNTAPPLTVAPPPNVFVPESVNVPVPLFAKLPLPLITPLYVVAADPPNVSVLPWHKVWLAVGCTVIAAGLSTTTTATVLAQAIVHEGMKYVAAGMNPMDLKRGIDKAVHALIDQLKKASKATTTSKEISQVGSISANSDHSIGEIIAKAMDKVGKEGVITVEDGKSLENELDIVEGMQFDRGYLSPYFINNPDKQIAALDNPFVLLFDKKISKEKRKWGERSWLYMDVKNASLKPKK